MADAPSVPVALRAIAAWLDAHPAAAVDQLKLDYFQKEYAVRCYTVHGAKQLAARAREIGGRWTKQVDEVVLFRLRQEIISGVFYELIVSRDQVCERVRVGETTITEPDPVAVEALPKQERVVPVYEWRCDPILGAAES